MPLDNETPGKRNNPMPSENQHPEEKLQAISAHLQAENDLEEDPDLNSRPKPESDLDEGELARLDNSNEPGESSTT